ncbi:hypothetical protein IQ250_24065 [Pseudanabaenaceae cyanobacterium LEGE 13415]|nr:hypothetical protein [Pseudanabaenaceae cyanobacterium LEGE 13415]
MVVLVDGMFWIDRDWNVQICDLVETRKTHSKGASSLKGTRSRKPRIDEGNET